MSEVKLPTSVELREALLQVLTRAPMGLSTKDIDQAVSTHLNLTTEQLAVIHSGNRTEIAYRLAWERTRAKSKGLIERTSARMWKLAD